MYVATSNDLLLMYSYVISTVQCFTTVIFIQYVEACDTVVEHFEYMPDLYGAVKLGDCSSVDQQELEMLNGFNINCN